MAVRRTIGMLAALTGASLMLTLGADAAPHNSIHLVLPEHIPTTKRLTIVLTGYASGTKPEVWLYSQPQRCPSTLTAEVKFNNQTIWISGGPVHGHYRYKDPVGFPSPTHGSQNFCAYLTSFSPTYSFITEAHHTVRFKIPR
jgi:hypothetical protein